MKTLAYDCGNPGQYVCGRYARSAFLFTGSPRFARDESEYVKTSNAKFEQLRGYPQASAEGIRVYEVKRSADRINTRIRTGRNAPERHTHESRVTHPGTTCHPSNGGELGTYHCGIKFPSAEGWRALRDGVVYSIAHACSNSYVPVESVYNTPADIFITSCWRK